MENETTNLIKSYKDLYEATHNPIFKTVYLYIEKTNNVVLLDGINLKERQQDFELEGEEELIL